MMPYFDDIPSLFPQIKKKDYFSLYYQQKDQKEYNQQKNKYKLFHEIVPFSEDLRIILPTEGLRNSLKQFIKNIQGMNKRNEENESNSSSQVGIHNLKHGGSYPHQHLQQIVYDDEKYTSTIIEFIRQGYNKVRKDELDNGLMYFNQAQKILEYGASCGRIIDRNLIICVLHNESCCYQKLNQLSKASKYLEAIIYNLKKNYQRSGETSPAYLDNIEFALFKNIPQYNSFSLRKKAQLAQYYLQFCSTNSQLRVRKAALDTAKTAIQIFKGFFMDLKMCPNLIGHVTSLDDEKITNSLRQYKNFKEDLELEELDEYIKIGKYYCKKWKTSVRISPKTHVDKLLKSYSIGDFVELEAKKYEQCNQENSSKFQPSQIVKQFLNFSMGYFQISTEYRLIAEETYKTDDYGRRNSEEYKLALLYHILAITLIALYVPYDMLFMEQIMSSYQHHFQQSLNDFLPEQYKPCIPLLFLIETQKKISLKKKKVFQMKSSSKKKKYYGLASVQKKENSHSKIKKNDNPRAVKEEYYADKCENQAKRSRRISSNLSKKSRKVLKKRIESTENCHSHSSKRERMKTKNDEEKIKKKERTFQEYCAFPSNRKKSVQRIDLGLSRCSHKNSRLISEEKHSTLRRNSTEKSFNKKIKMKQNHLKTIKSPLKRKKPIEEKEKKKMTPTIKKYYL